MRDAEIYNLNKQTFEAARRMIEDLRRGVQLMSITENVQYKAFLKILIAKGLVADEAEYQKVIGEVIEEANRKIATPEEAKAPEIKEAK